MLTSLLALCLAQAPDLPIRVVDQATKEPIPGATVFGIAEGFATTWGSLDFAHKLVTDDSGSVTLPAPTEAGPYDWIVIQADGYGLRSEMENRRSSSPRVFELVPETPITIVLRDFTGAPLPLAHLGVCVGCGHTPDIVTTTTGIDGRATLRGVADVEGICDLYFVHPETHMPFYDRVPFDDVKDGVAIVYAEPGSTLRGEIRLKNGEPAVGHTVGNNIHHRGFWTKTDDRGRFVLYGAETRPEYLKVHDPSGKEVGWFSESRAGVARRLVLGEPEKPREHTVTVELKGTDPGQPLGGVIVEAWDTETGYAVRGKTGENGAASLQLPAGVFHVEVGGPETPYRARTIAKVDLGAQGTEPRTLGCLLEAPNRVTLLAQGLQAGDELYVQTASGARTSWEVDASGAVRVEDWAVPSGRFGAYAWRTLGEASFERIQLRSVPLGEGTLELVDAP